MTTRQKPQQSFWGLWNVSFGFFGIQLAFGLQNVQKLRDDDPLGGGRTPANKAFEAVGNAGSKSAADMFA